MQALEARVVAVWFAECGRSAETPEDQPISSRRCCEQRAGGASTVSWIAELQYYNDGDSNIKVLEVFHRHVHNDAPITIMTAERAGVSPIPAPVQ